MVVQPLFAEASPPRLLLNGYGRENPLQISEKIMPSSQKNLMRRSGASFDQKQPDPLTFFLDRNLGKHIIADILREAGALVEVHDDHFPAGAKDNEWLAAVGEKGWVVLTKDQRIRYRGLELKALEEAQVKAFVLTSGNLQGHDMAAIFVKALPAMQKYVINNDPPFIARLTSQGKVSPIK